MANSSDAGRFLKTWPDWKTKRWNEAWALVDQEKNRLIIQMAALKKHNNQQYKPRTRISITNNEQQEERQVERPKRSAIPADWDLGSSSGIPKPELGEADRFGHGDEGSGA